MKKVWFLVLGITALLFLAACSTGEATSSNECKKLSGRCGFVTGEDLTKKFELDCKQVALEVEEDFKETSGNEVCGAKGVEKGVASFCINGFVAIGNKNGGDYFQPTTSCTNTVTLDSIMAVWKEADSSGFGADGVVLAYTCCSVG